MYCYPSSMDYGGDRCPTMPHYAPLQPYLADSESTIKQEVLIPQPMVLIIGVGNQSDAQRWNDYAGFLGYAWESLDLECNIPNCHQIDFNDIQQLDTLPNNYYDMITLDRSMQFFIQDWTYLQFFILKKKLKMNGQLHLSTPAPVFNRESYQVHADNIQEASEMVYHRLVNQLIQQLSSSNKINFRLGGDSPDKIYIRNQPLNYQQYNQIIRSAENRILDQFALFNMSILTVIFGYAEYRDKPEGYFGPDVENDQTYYYAQKTTEHLNIDPEIMQQYPHLVDQPLALLNVYRDALMGSIFFT